ncbi:MAG TPA: hypothetical protein VFP80_10645, partial [Thermoanaerobaculia bacterium]|nr:hypothetical protein [Thermoanaerobaculia bacterium]
SMPSDATALEALHVVSGAIAAYQTRVAAVADRIGHYLAASDESSGGGVEAEQLGEFASGRIDIERFSALWEEREALDQSERNVLEHAHDLLRDIATRPGDYFITNLQPGARLTATLAHTFADFGRSFGAMMIAEMVRTGRFRTEDFELLHGFPRFRWTRAERGMSPPVIVTLDGADLWAGEVAQYLDGNQKIILVVRPPAPPAALVRLITPGTLVIQSCNVAGLEPLLAVEGPAVAALMPDGAAEFIHRPGSAPSHERITISTKPAGARKGVEGWTTWQQQQELDQLYTLAAAPVIAQEKQPQPASDPADRLASWLLSHSDLSPASIPSATTDPS